MTTEETKQYHISDILSVTTGILVSTRHVEGVYDILNYMTGDDLYIHQLPRAMEECAPYLLREHQWLADVDASTVNSETWEAWLREQIAEHGEWHLVRPIHLEDHAVRDPIEELQEMVGDKPVVVLSDQVLRDIQDC